MAKFDGLALFSGGLDSLLAIKVLQEQGLKILGLHFFSPFFGNPSKLEKWQEEYGLQLIAIDISQEYLKMLLNKPAHGLGSVLNPCIDCKILMLKEAKKLLPSFGASFLVSGEVLGQRPMSQRKDTLPLIVKKAEVEDILVRPLTALNLEPTLPERKGIIDRSKLLGFKGRGRKGQLALAKKFGFKDFATPAGGCLLTDPEISKRYTTILKNIDTPTPRHFEWALWGRHFWWEKHWLIIGRNKTDNESLLGFTREEYILRLVDFPGPVAIAVYPLKWDKSRLKEAASFLIHFAPKALRSGKNKFKISLKKEGLKEVLEVDLKLKDAFNWQEPIWYEEIKRSLNNK